MFDSKGFKKYMTSRLKEKTFKKYKTLDQRYETIGRIGEGEYGDDVSQ